MNDGNMKFKNLTRLPSGSWQLKFKKDGKEYQPVAPTLESALIARNEVYLKANFRPNYLFVNMFDMSSVCSGIGEDKPSGNSYHRYQVHARGLIDRKYAPKGFNSKVAADKFAKKWLKNYNAIAAIYNGKREERFLEQIDLELKTLEPHIVTGFDVILWLYSARQYFGDTIPEFFFE